MAKIYGNNYIILVGGLPFGCEVSFSLKAQAGEITLAGRNYDWDESVATTKNATLDITGLFEPDDSLNVNDFFDYFSASTLLDFQIDDLNSLENNFYFQGRLVSWNIDSNLDNFVTFSCTVRVTGAISREPAYYMLLEDGDLVLQEDGVSLIEIVDY